LGGWEGGRVVVVVVVVVATTLMKQRRFDVGGSPPLLAIKCCSSFSFLSSSTSSYYYASSFRYDVVALHIDYGNRDESEREADYVGEWCDHLGIIFRKRVIREVVRGITNRDDYEKITRDIRFDFYKQVKQQNQQVRSDGGWGC